MVVYLIIGSVILVAMVGSTAFLAAKANEYQERRKRIESIAAKTRKNGSNATDDNSSNNFRKRKIQDKLKQMEETNKRKNKGSVRELIHMAGLNITPMQFWLYSFGFGLVVAFFWFLINGKGLGLVLVWLFATFVFPKRHLKKRGLKRQKKFTTLFADALDIIVRGIRSGLPVGECLKMIGREMPEPVGQEFRLIVEGQKLGLTLNEIMDRALERMPTDDFKFFAVVLAIQQQTGGNLAETLDKLSNVLRGRKKMKDKVQALSSEAKASAMIIGSLPFCMMGILKLIAPDYIGLLFGDTLGHIMMIGGLTWMSIGILVMKQMINFDF